MKTSTNNETTISHCLSWKCVLMRSKNIHPFYYFFVHSTTWIVLCAKWLPWPLPSHQYRMNTCLVIQVQLTVSNQETSFSRIIIPRWIIFSQLSQRTHNTWWRHQMETFSALLAICAGNSPVPGNSPHKGQWRGALMFSLICVWINGWVNNREAGDLRR